MDETYDVAPLAAALQRPLDTAVVVGAAISSFVPTSTPGTPLVIQRVVLSMLTELERREPGFLDDPENREVAAQLLEGGPDAGDAARSVTPFESLLDTLERCGNLATSVTSALVLGRSPNVLHRFLGGYVVSGGTVITTNFDDAIERSVGAPTSLRVWFPNGPPRAGDRLLKVHGCASQPDTLRHSLRTVNRRFGDATRSFCHAATATSIVVLGYRGADYDVIDLISPVGERIYWLERPPAGNASRAKPEGAERLAQTRSVTIVWADLDEVAGQMGLGAVAWGGNDASEFASRLGPIVRSMATRDLVAALTELIFDARVSSPACRKLDDQFAAYRSAVQPESPATIAYQAGRDHDSGSVPSKLKSASAYLRLARNATGVQATQWRSAAGDALDGLVLGQGPGLRLYTRRWHRAAAESAPADKRGWYLFRWARSERSWGNWDRTERLIREGLECDNSTWEEGHMWRMLALCQARGHVDFQESIERSRELFQFAAQKRALADLERTEGICHLLVGDEAAAQASLESAQEQHALNDQMTGRLQTKVILALLRLRPSLARFLAVRM